MNFIKPARRLLFNHDQAMLTPAAVNVFYLGLDKFIAHNLNGTLVPNEWIPILFCPIADLVLLTIVGMTGAILPINTNLTGQGVIIVERFLRGAPILAPLLFCNMGLPGYLVLLED